MIFGHIFPPIVVFHDGTDHWTADGFHRLAAARRAKVLRLAANVFAGTKREALLYAVGANTDHGLRRTNGDKRNAVDLLLADPEWRQWSGEEIARQCGVSNFLVSEMKAERRSLLAAKSEPSPSTSVYTTKHGTVAKMDTARIGKGSGQPAADLLRSLRDADVRGIVQDDGLKTCPSCHQLWAADVALCPYCTVAPVARVEYLSGGARKHAVHFSSQTPEHYTPAIFLDAVYTVFGGIPDLDPCSNSREHPNVEAHKHYIAVDDGLVQPWHGRVFMNPPYGREIGAWIDKVRAEWKRGEMLELIALLPSRTDTAWFNALTSDTDDVVVCLLAGRLTFIGNDEPAPFPSMAVYFGPRHDVFADVFLSLGSLWQRPARPREWFVNHEVDQ